MKRLVVLVLVSLLALIPAIASCEETADVNSILQQQKRITALGSALIRVAPDCADVYLGVDTYDAQFAAALQKNNDIVQKVAEATAAMKLDANSMNTVNRTVNTVYGIAENSTTPARIKGYRIVQSIVIHVNDITLISDVIGKAIDAGATTVDSVIFGCSDAIAIHDEALSLAIQDATRKATLMAAKSNAAVGEVLSVEEKTEEQPTMVVIKEDGGKTNAAFDAAFKTATPYFGLKKMKLGEVGDMSQWVDLMSDELEFSAKVVMVFQLTESK